MSLPSWTSKLRICGRRTRNRMLPCSMKVSVHGVGASITIVRPGRSRLTRKSKKKSSLHPIEREKWHIQASFDEPFRMKSSRHTELGQKCRYWNLWCIALALGGSGLLLDGMDGLRRRIGLGCRGRPSCGGPVESVREIRFLYNSFDLARLWLHQKRLFSVPQRLGSLVSFAGFKGRGAQEATCSHKPGQALFVAGRVSRS